MKYLLTSFAALLLCGSTAVAGKSANCCTPRSAQCAPAACKQWYKAKDGTLREMVPYWTALSRAEDADDLEIKLRGVEADLVASKAETEAQAAAAAALKSQLENQIAELTKQLDAERQKVASQTERANTAEASLKQSQDQVAELRESGKKSEAQLTAVTAERDGLKTEQANLQKQVTELSEAKAAAESAKDTAQTELNKLKQDAAETRKTEIENEAAEKSEGDGPKPDGEETASGSESEKL